MSVPGICIDIVVRRLTLPTRATWIAEPLSLLVGTVSVGYLRREFLSRVPPRGVHDIRALLMIAETGFAADITLSAKLDNVLGWVITGSVAGSVAPLWGWR